MGRQRRAFLFAAVTAQRFFLPVTKQVAFLASGLSFASWQRDGDAQTGHPTAAKDVSVNSCSDFRMHNERRWEEQGFPPKVQIALEGL